MVVIAKIMIATDRDRDSLRFDLPVRRSTRTRTVSFDTTHVVKGQGLWLWAERHRFTSAAQRRSAARRGAAARLMLLLCCNLLSLAEGGSTTVVAWGVHLPSTYHCSVIVRHHTPHIRHRNGRRNTQKSETIAEVHGNSASTCRVFWARSFRLSSGSTHISLFKHRCAAPPCVLRFWCFLLFTSSSRSAAALRLPRSLLLPLIDYPFSLVYGQRSR